MNNTTLARSIYERRFRGSPYLTPGELINLIGHDGINEALKLAWLIPDTDTGLLMLNIHGGKLKEIFDACKCRHCGKTDCKCTVKDKKETLTMPMREAFRGPGLSAPQTFDKPQPVMARSNTSPTPAVTTANKPYRYGDPVMVENNGVMYRGEISGFEPDGRIRVRWRGPKPPEDRPYSPGEFIVDKNK